MTTKYSGNWRSNRWWFFSMLIIIVLTVILSTISAEAKSVDPIQAYTPDRGGECLAKFSSTELIQGPDGYCRKTMGNPSGLSLTQIAVKLWKGAVTSVATMTSVTDIPTAIVTETPSPEATEPPATETATQVTGDDPAETPEVTVPPATSTQITETPKPTKTATPSPAPKPTKECNNKNDDKKPGENPTDCNAGGGNG